MARKDEILMNFLEHNIIAEKYNIQPKELPKTVRDALNSKHPIVKAIALIVDQLEPTYKITDSALRNLITQYLNNAAI
jgi:hypothetical protein